MAEEGEVTTFKRICVRDFKVTAGDGGRFKVERGKEYITSDENDRGDVVVFANYWMPVPASFFAGELRFT